jgi:hypothetical protein
MVEINVLPALHVIGRYTLGPSLCPTYLQRIRLLFTCDYAKQPTYPD